MLVLLAAINLRPAIASVGPVLERVLSDLGLSAGVGGLLTSLPVFLFGGFAFLAPALVSRFGVRRTLTVVLGLIAVGIVVRVVPGQIGPVALWTGTVLAGAAIAIGNVVVPATIKQERPDDRGAMTAIYTAAIGGGAALAAGLSVPAAGLLGGWRPALAAWAAPALLGVVAWVVLARGPGPAGPVDQRGSAARPTYARLLGDPVGRAVTVYMGLQSLGYFALLTWGPTILVDAGIDAVRAGLLVSWASAAGAATSLLTPPLAARARRAWVPVTVVTVVSGLGFVGLITAPGEAPLLWMTLLGVSQGASLSLAISFIVWRSPDTRVTARLSTLAQGAGYLVAGLGPLVVGTLHEVTSAWTLPLSVLVVLLVGQGVAGVRAARREHVLSARA